MRFPPRSRWWTPSPAPRPVKPIWVRSDAHSPRPAMTGEPVTIPALLRRRIADRVDHPLLICPGGRLSYGVAEKRSAQLARGLIALGACKVTHLGVLYPHMPDFLYVILSSS